MNTIRRSPSLNSDALPTNCSAISLRSSVRGRLAAPPGSIDGAALAPPLLQSLGLEYGRAPFLGQLIAGDVDLVLHPRLGAVLGQSRLILLADEGILVLVGNGGAAVADVDGAGIERLLAGDAGLAGALVVGAVPGREPQRLGADAEMLVEPVAA